ncbi:MAG TPA: hypothetical protein VLA71_14505 [Algoriphagus sp.]|nr:hypothetical protein [Algoriphagus sp.]
MKKILFAFLPMFFLSLISYGQLQKGNVMLGGAVNFYSNSSTYDSGFGNNSETKSFTFSPDVGFFVKDNWVFGLNTTLFWSNQEIDFNSDVASESSTADISTRETGVEPYVRKYFPLGNQFSFFGQLGAGINASKITAEYRGGPANPVEEDVSNSFQVTTEMGLVYFPKTWLGIELAFVPFTYRSNVRDVTRPQSESNFNSNYFDFGVNTSAIFLGVNFFLPKK